MPLLKKQIEVSRVAIDGLAVTLVSRSESENNWQDLGESTDRRASQLGAGAQDLDCRRGYLEVLARVPRRREEERHAV